ncbi:hemagglutinin/amebocyte aggregation factor isoform X2 [Nematostella vectensis]|uniref:hemagglutinin/amebocyte aggregation factor isoform X2 n=1 Tax=Nematostella vectensis TaxID=45351 RepID=UPI00207750E1|nr:hemagglutinin/amebocyte aggregation factor isoform X2 [Nematostella vectensis]
MNAIRNVALLLALLVLADMFVNTDAWRPPCHPPALPSTYRWYNQWGGSFNVKCPAGSTLSMIRSLYSRCHHDRVFSFACKYSRLSYTTGSEVCNWSSSYVNSYLGAMSFTCPGNGFVAGVHSEHSNSAGDRRFKFKCCSRLNVQRYGCYTTGHINDYQQIFHYALPHGTYLAGVESHFNASKRDRLWKLRICGARVRLCKWSLI